MNKNLILIATTLALSLSWAGCNKSGKLAQHSTFTPPAGPVELKLKWPQGERVVQDMDMKENLDITIPGQANPIEQVVTMGQEYGLTVLKENPDGGHEVEMEFLSARMGQTQGGKTLLDYDSAKKSADGKPNPVADMFGRIIGSKIQFFLDPSNRVERMEGVDELVNSVSSGVQADQAAILKSMFSEGYFKQLMSHYIFLPPNAVQPGDTWPVQFEFPMEKFGTLVMDYTATFQTWEMHGTRNCARMDFQGTIKSKPDTNSAPTGMTITSLDGTSSGVSWFDPELGITIDTDMNQDMNMGMDIPLNPGSKNGRTQSLTIALKQVTSVKLASVK